MGNPPVNRIEAKGQTDGRNQTERVLLKTRSRAAPVERLRDRYRKRCVLYGIGTLERELRLYWSHRGQSRGGGSRVVQS